MKSCDHYKTSTFKASEGALYLTQQKQSRNANCKSWWSENQPHWPPNTSWTFKKCASQTTSFTPVCSTVSLTWPQHVHLSFQKNGKTLQQKGTMRAKLQIDLSWNFPQYHYIVRSFRSLVRMQNSTVKRTCEEMQGTIISGSGKIDIVKVKVQEIQYPFTNNY